MNDFREIKLDLNGDSREIKLDLNGDSRESKSSKKLQLQFPTDLIDKIEVKAKNAGVSINQYILFLLIKDAKKSEKV